MRPSIPGHIRQAVANRANFRCEYCRIHRDDMFLAFHLDHIIPIKHGGASDLGNLAYACPHCNHAKGPDFATIVKDEIVRLFNPRADDWAGHFEVVHVKIIARSIIGQASIRIFCFNEPDSLILRQILIEGGRYP